MDKKKRLSDLIIKIEEKNSNGIKHIYRGTNKEFSKEEDGVSSNLYRWGKRSNVVFNDEVLPQYMENNIVDITRRYFPASTNNIEILAEIQHLGGKTNLIDFSSNLYIALFFACYENSENNAEEHGELVLFKSKASTSKINYNNPSKVNQVVYPPITQTSKGRINTQSSIFVYPARGYLDIGINEQVTIEKDLKKYILNWLDEFHNINQNTIFNDLLGFIQDDENLKTYTAFLLQGYSKQQQGNHDGAINDYDKALEINPQLEIGYTNRANSKIKRGDYYKAIEDCDKALKINPFSSIAFNNRGNAFIGLKKYPKAIKDYDKAIDIAPQYSTAYYNRGIAKVGLQQYHNAIKDYDKAIELDPNYIIAYNNRANTKIELKLYKDAINDCNKCIELDKSHANAYYNLGKAQAALGDKEKAKENFKKAKDLGC